MSAKPCSIIDRSEILTMIIERHDGNDLDETTAREVAEAQLLDERKLGGYGGSWYFLSTSRLNYNRVQVIFGY